MKLCQECWDGYSAEYATDEVSLKGFLYRRDSIDASSVRFPYFQQAPKQSRRGYLEWRQRWRPGGELR